MPQSRSQEKAGQELEMISTVVSVLPVTAVVMVVAVVSLSVSAVVNSVMLPVSVVSVTVEYVSMLFVSKVSGWGVTCVVSILTTVVEVEASC